MAQINMSGQYATTEADALPLIPQEVANEVINGITEASAVLSLFRRLPNMSSRTLRMPVLNSMGAASFIAGTVNDDLELGADVEAPDSVAETGIPGLKSTHQMEWTNVYIHAERWRSYYQLAKMYLRTANTLYGMKSDLASSRLSE